jgi:hypothetical protein
MVGSVSVGSIVIAPASVAYSVLVIVRMSLPPAPTVGLRLVRIMFAFAGTAFHGSARLSVGGCSRGHVRGFRLIGPGSGVDRGDEYQRHADCQDPALAETHEASPQ